MDVESFFRLQLLDAGPLFFLFVNNDYYQMQTQIEAKSLSFFPSLSLSILSLFFLSFSFSFLLYSLSLFQFLSLIFYCSDGQKADHDLKSILDVLQLSVVDADGNEVKGEGPLFLEIFLIFNIDFQNTQSFLILKCVFYFFLSLLFFQGNKDVGDNALNWLYTPTKAGNYTLAIKQDVRNIFHLYLLYFFHFFHLSLITFDSFINILIVFPIRNILISLPFTYPRAML